MNKGMLWFDNDPKTEILTKVARAAAYFQNKYGQPPNLCFVHPSMVKETAKDTPVKSGNVELRPSRAVLPNHFWIGYNEQ